MDTLLDATVSFIFELVKPVVFNRFRSAAHFQPGGLATAHQCLQVFF